MSDTSAKPVIFISYSHKDEPDEFLQPGETRWLSYVKSFLEPAKTHGRVELWDDRHIDGGGDWRGDINEALERCGSVESYAFRKVGAFGSSLAAISWFFEKPYERPIATLAAGYQYWVLGEAAFALRAQGRFGESLPALCTALQLAKEAKNWRNAAIAATNLSEAELLTGEVAAAVATAEQSVAHADQSGDEYHMMVRRTAQANALYAAGRREEAKRLFADAERRQKKHQPKYPLLYSVRGHQYCSLILARRERAAARDRASQTLKWGGLQYALLDIALDKLTLGRAYLGLALENAQQRPATSVHDDARTAQTRLGEAVDGLRASNSLHHVPRGLLARAAFRRSVGDWDGAARDLDEVEEIAEPGPMRLFLCDMALERARLAFARIAAFAPLNGLIDDSPPKPAPLGADERAKLAEEARVNLAEARKLIEKCGYHRRDEELAVLEAVFAGHRRFADLPPRV
jgi:tetratricopeptide (TPR) repeat protein